MTRSAIGTVHNEELELFIIVEKRGRIGMFALVLRVGYSIHLPNGFPR